MPSPISRLSSSGWRRRRPCIRSCRARETATPEGHSLKPRSSTISLNTLTSNASDKRTMFFRQCGLTSQNEVPAVPETSNSGGAIFPSDRSSIIFIHISYSVRCPVQFQCSRACSALSPAGPLAPHALQLTRNVVRKLISSGTVLPQKGHSIAHVARRVDVSEQAMFLPHEFQELPFPMGWSGCRCLARDRVARTSDDQPLRAMARAPGS